jgi:hypothetical protein
MCSSGSHLQQIDAESDWVSGTCGLAFFLEELAGA